MTLLKKILAVSTLVLLFVATYMRLTGMVIEGHYRAGRTGPVVTGYDSGNSVFLCALLTGGGWCLVAWKGRQRL